MVTVLASNAVDRGFTSRSSKTKEYKIGMCCFSEKEKRLLGENFFIRLMLSRPIYICLNSKLKKIYQQDVFIYGHHMDRRELLHVIWRYNVVEFVDFFLRWMLIYKYKTCIFIGFCGVFFVCTAYLPASSACPNFRTTCAMALMFALQHEFEL